MMNLCSTFYIYIDHLDSLYDDYKKREKGHIKVIKPMWRHLQSLEALETGNWENYPNNIRKILHTINRNGI